MSNSPCSLSIPNKQRHRRQLRLFFFALVRGFLFFPNSATTTTTTRKASPPKALRYSSEVKPIVEKEEETSLETEEESKGIERGEVMGGGGDVAVELQRSVKQLLFGSWEEKEAAAEEIRRVAGEDCLVRKLLASLGVIPSLVAMLDSGDDRCRRLAIQALIELANGTYTNKALMLEAGILKKLPALMCTGDQSRRRDLLALLLSISSLATKTEIPITTCIDIIPILLEILDSNNVAGDEAAKLLCLGILYNLSTKLSNTRALISSGAVPTLLRLSQEKATAERALATLGNLVVTAMGRKAIEEEEEMVPKDLMEILSWEEKPRCQELAIYIVMVLVCGSSAAAAAAQRQRMVELGVVPLLLEVALLGSPLAQKRALKTLQWFKECGGRRGGAKVVVGVHSGPQQMESMIFSPVSNGSPGGESRREVRECKKEMKRMVRQSLDKNMESIMRRAASSSDGGASKLVTLAASPSTKSLPY